MSRLMRAVRRVFDTTIGYTGKETGWPYTSCTQGPWYCHQVCISLLRSSRTPALSNDVLKNRWTACSGNSTNHAGFLKFLLVSFFFFFACCAKCSWGLLSTYKGNPDEKVPFSNSNLYHYIFINKIQRPSSDSSINSKREFIFIYSKQRHSCGCIWTRI